MVVIEMKTKVGIVGSRKYENLAYVKRTVSFLPKEFYIVVSGHGNGVDTAAEEEAERLGIETLIFPPDVKPNCTNQEFAIAAFARNTKIAEACDYLIAFWDGKSKGTLDTIVKCAKLGKLVIIKQREI